MRASVIVASVVKKDKIRHEHVRASVIVASVAKKDKIRHEHVMASVIVASVAKKDKIRHEHVRASVIVASVAKKITEKRLTWDGHVKRRDVRAKKNGRWSSGRKETEDRC